MQASRIQNGMQSKGQVLAKLFTIFITCLQHSIRFCNLLAKRFPLYLSTHYALSALAVLPMLASLALVHNNICPLVL